MEGAQHAWSDGVPPRTRLALHRWVMPALAALMSLGFTFSALEGFGDPVRSVSSPTLAVLAAMVAWRAWRTGVPSLRLERALVITAMASLVASAVELVFVGRFELGYPFVVGYAPIAYTSAFLFLGAHLGWRASGVMYLGLAGATVGGVVTGQIPMFRAVPLVGWHPILIALLFAVAWSFSRASRDRAQAMEEASVDPLTGALNRRSGERGLSLLAGPYGLLMIDLDHFKRLNDKHGHAFGDEVLKTVARTVSTYLRPADLVVRWGGDEFLVVAPGATRESAAALARRVEEAVSSASEELGTVLSVSIGVAAREDDADWLPVFVRADRAMYEVKRSREA